MTLASTMRLESFVTLRLLAERLTPAHRPDLRRMDQDAEMMALVGGPRDEAGTDAYLELNLAHWAKFGFGLWMLRARTSGQIVGRACVRHLVINERDEVEIGYGFLPAHWGQGLATEIAGACVDLAFNAIRLPSIVALTSPENMASQRVLTKAGLAYEEEVDLGGQPHLLFRRRTTRAG
jgi:RimJ/RimL family protein N-acetyltransferase